LFGVDIVDVDARHALQLVERALARESSPPLAIFFVNAHTLSLASEDPRYRAVLREAEYVFGDGAGVRWAIRYTHGLRLRDNVNGTDLVPELLRRPAVPGRSYYLLGASPEACPRAAEEARRRFPDWELRGYHHGYLGDDATEDVISRINAAGVDLLLVGMGNPRQELWIHENAKRLDVRVCVGVGGLFDYWAGDLDRAPVWMRRAGIEWIHLMLRQPRKLRRYLIEGPRFLWRAARERRPEPTRSR
jgi:N-acetylglucosaminyldiphosphoundecaprenol N-acetyl-beta-D-mannosaminyltransferase